MFPVKPKLSLIGILVLAVSGIVIASGCLEQQMERTAVAADLGKAFQLKADETAFIESEGLRVRFLGITEDSRCPAAAKCVWGGRATILVNVSKGGKSIGDFNLTEGGSLEAAAAAFDGYSVKLVKLDPYPTTGPSIKISDYVATLVVSKRAGEFCGWSTYGECATDSDCGTSGCSGQVCKSLSEASVVTTCEWQSCYSDEKYGVQCACAEGKCQWVSRA
jgi:eight-cysteine-cluster-containing protein